MLEEVLKKIAADEIQEVSLVGQQIGDTGAIALAKALANNKSVHALHLSNNNIGIEGITSLAKMLETNTNIRHLGLSSNPFGDEGVYKLTSAIQINNAVVSLNLSSCGITSRGLLAIADLLLNRHSIHSLSLDYVAIGMTTKANTAEYNALRALMEAIAVDTTLNSLNFAHCYLGSDGANLVASMLKNNRTLKYLDLRGSGIDASGMLVLADALKVNKVLTSISLLDNQIGVEGAKYFVEMIRHNSCLNAINFNFRDRSIISQSDAVTLQNKLSDNIKKGQLLIQAAEKGDLESVKRAVEAGSCLSHTDGYRKTALQIALEKNHENVARYLRQTRKNTIEPLVASNAVNVFKKAQALLLQNDVAEAIKQLDEAILLNNNFADYYYYRAQAKGRLMLLEDAIADYDEAIRINPHNDEYYAGRANVKSALQQNEAAIADYDKAILINPNEAIYFGNRGRIKLSSQLDDEAIRDLDEAIRLKPGISIFYSDRASAKYRLQRYEDAITDLDIAIQETPTFPIYYVNRASAKFKLQRYEAAIADYDHAIQIDSNNDTYYYYRAEAKRELQRHEAAIADYNEAIKINPSNEMYKSGRVSASNHLRYESAGGDAVIRIKPSDEKPPEKIPENATTISPVVEHHDSINPSQQTFVDQILLHAAPTSASTQTGASMPINHPGQDLRKELKDKIDKLKNAIANPDKDLPVDYTFALEKIMDNVHGYNSLHLAAWYGEKNFLVLAENHGASFDLVGKNGETLLHCAMVNDQREVINYLLSLPNCNINVADENGDTPLHWAAKYGQEDLVKFLVSKGADFRILNKAKKAPANLAKDESHDKVVQFLVTEDLLLVIANNDLAQAKRPYYAQLISDFTTIQNADEDNIALITLKHNQYDLFKYFIGIPDQGKRFFNSKDKNGNTLLHAAADSINDEFIKFILSPTAPTVIPVDSQNNYQQTPLHLAILKEGRHANIAKLLDKKDSVHLKADIELFPGKTESLDALELAAAKGDLPTIKYIVKKGIVVTRDILWQSVKYDQISLLRYFLSDSNFKKEMYLPNADGQHLLSYAAALGRKKIIWLLVDIFKFKIDYCPTSAGNNRKWTALQWATYKNQHDAVRLLLQLNASPTYHAVGENDPFQIANNCAQQATDPSIQTDYRNIHHLLADALQNRHMFTFDYNREFLPKNLVFQGGGPRGIAHLGALQALEKHIEGKKETWGYIQRVAGTSAGAIVATLLAVGYSPNELEQELTKKQLTDFLDFDIQSFKKQDLSFWNAIKTYTKCIYELKSFNPISCAIDQGVKLVTGTIGDFYQQAGLCSGNDFLAWIEELIFKKTNIKHLTMGELSNLVQGSNGKYKHLTIVGLELGETGTKGWEFSSEDSSMSNYIVSDLVRISMSIPGVFKPHRIYVKVNVQNAPKRLEASDNNKYYVDGGTFKNFPLDVYDYAKYQNLDGDPNYRYSNPYTLGFSLVSDSTKKAQQNNDLVSSLLKALQNKIGNEPNLINLVRDLASAYYNSESVIRSFEPQTQYTERTVAIDDLGSGTLDFNMSPDDQKKLIESGANGVKTFYSTSLKGFHNDGNDQNNIVMRNYVLNSNAGLDLAARYTTLESRQIQTSTGIQLKPVLLSTLATTTSTLFSWLPRSVPTIKQATSVSQQTKTQTKSIVLDQGTTDGLHVSAAMSVSKKIKHTFI